MMKFFAIKLVGIALTCGLFAQPATAALLVTGGSSSVSASAGIDGPGLTVSDSVAYPGVPSFVSAPSSSASAGVSAAASQTSTVPNATGTSITSTGSASHSLSIDPSHSGSAQATSFFDVFFDLDTPHSFTFTRTGVDTSTFAAVVVELKQFDGATYNAIIFNNGGFSLTDSGVLAAGAYELTAQAFSGDSVAFPPPGYDSSGADQYEVSLTVSPVPEPSGLVLGALGVAGLLSLGLVRRRHKQR